MSANAGKKKDRSEANEARELIQLAKDAGLTSMRLDEDVHEIKASEASDINNRGMEAQIKYLYESLGLAGAKEIILRLGQDAKKEGPSPGSR